MGLLGWLGRENVFIGRGVEFPLIVVGGGRTDGGVGFGGIVSRYCDLGPADTLVAVDALFTEGGGVSVGCLSAFGVLSPPFLAVVGCSLPVVSGSAGDTDVEVPPLVGRRKENCGSLGIDLVVGLVVGGREGEAWGLGEGGTGGLGLCNR